MLSGLCGLLVPLVVDGGAGLRKDRFVGFVTPLKCKYPCGDGGAPGVADLARSLGNGDGSPSSDPIAEEISLFAVSGRVDISAILRCCRPD